MKSTSATDEVNDDDIESPAYEEEEDDEEEEYDEGVQLVLQQPKTSSLSSTSDNRSIPPTTGIQPQQQQPSQQQPNSSSLSFAGGRSTGQDSERVSTGMSNNNELGLGNANSVYDMDLSTIQDKDKPWRQPGADITDYFNYGFDERSWNEYRQKQLEIRLQRGMQRKIQVFESQGEGGGTRGQQLPPRLSFGLGPSAQQQQRSTIQYTQQIPPEAVIRGAVNPILQQQQHQYRIQPQQQQTRLHPHVISQHEQVQAMQQRQQQQNLQQQQQTQPPHKRARHGGAHIPRHQDSAVVALGTNNAPQHAGAGDHASSSDRYQQRRQSSPYSHPPQHHSSSDSTRDRSSRRDSRERRERRSSRS